MPETIRVYFLGTGGSTPFSGKKYPCIALRYLNYLILFDTGEGCQFSLIEKKIHPLRFETIILLTHYHADHTSGLVGLLHTYNLMGMKHKVTLIGPIGLKNFLTYLTRAFLIDDFYFPISFIEVNPTEIKNKTLEVYDNGKFKILAFPTNHSAPSLGYVFKENPIYKLDPKKLEELKVPYHLRKKLSRGEFIIVGSRKISPKDVSKAFFPGRKIVYTGDTLPIENTVLVSKNADLLIHEATFLDDALALERYHSSLSGALNIAKKANVKRLALVHISSRYRIEDIEKEIDEKEDSLEIILPEDGDVLTL